MENFEEINKETVFTIIGDATEKAELLAEEFLMDFENNSDATRTIKMSILMDQIRTIQDALRDY